MHAMLIAAILLYIASKMSPRMLLGVKLAFFFLFLLPLTLLLWHVGAWQTVAGLLWNVFKAFVEVFWLFLKLSYGTIFD